MRIDPIATLTMLTLALAGCDTWPPAEKQIVENFLENREQLVELEAKLTESKYFDVSALSPEWPEGRFELGGEIAREFIDDDSEWGKLTWGARVWRVTREEDTFSFAVRGPISKSRAVQEVAYVHFVSGDSDLKACKPDHRDLMCGVCGVEIEPSWWVKYIWYPWPETDKEIEQLFGEVIPDEQFGDAIGAFLTKCQRDGLTAIGYEIE